MQARDVMVRDVVTVHPEATVRAVAQLLVERRISGVPVVDAEGRLVGIITEGDLIRRAELGTEPRRSRWLEYFIGPDVAAEEFVRAHALRAADVMTKRPESVSEDADLGEVAMLMERRHVKRLPVVRDGRLVGIVSRSNLVQALASLPAESLPEMSADDRELRERVLQAIREQPFGAPWLVSVVVNHGVVELWGAVYTDSERRTIRVAAEAVPGVTEIRDHLAIRPVAYGAE
jgi:CBS domain-containing protein